MKHYIQCEMIQSTEDFHKLLAETLSFPQWYGRNLDALYDLLTGIPIETHLILVNWNTVQQSLQKFKFVLDEAEENNNMFYVEYR